MKEKVKERKTFSVYFCRIRELNSQNEKKKARIHLIKFNININFHYQTRISNNYLHKRKIFTLFRYTVLHKTKLVCLN